MSNADDMDIIKSFKLVESIKKNLTNILSAQEGYDVDITGVYYNSEDKKFFGYFRKHNNYTSSKEKVFHVTLGEYRIYLNYKERSKNNATD